MTGLNELEAAPEESPRDLAAGAPAAAPGAGVPTPMQTGELLKRHEALH